MLARIAPVIASSLMLVLASCNGGSPGPEDLDGGVPADTEVAVVDFGFEPDDVRVEVGGGVEFRLDGDVAHTVTATGDDAFFDSGILEPGETFTVVFDEPGEFPYRCDVHPGQMTGVVVVTDDG